MQEKKLRDALVKVRERLRMFNYQARELDDIADYIGYVLTSIGPETEMEKLRGWLKEELKRERRITICGDPSVEIAALNQCAVYESVLVYITTQFGEEEGDADRRD